MSKDEVLKELSNLIEKNMRSEDEISPLLENPDVVVVSPEMMEDILDNSSIESLSVTFGDQDRPIEYEVIFEDGSGELFRVEE